MLDVDGLLQGADHGSHLARAAVTVAVGAAHWIGDLRARLGAFAHRLVVLDHAHRAVIALLIQAGAGNVEIWRATTQETESGVRRVSIANTGEEERGEYKVEFGERSGAGKGIGDGDAS